MNPTQAVVEAQMPMIGLPFMGLPGLTVTTGRVEGPLGPTPVGVQIAADLFREDLLLDAGAAIAQTVPVAKAMKLPCAGFIAASPASPRPDWNPLLRQASSSKIFSAAPDPPSRS